MFHVKQRPTYKELLMKVDAFHELRAKIRGGLSAIPQTSGGEILSIDVDPDTADLLVTWQHTAGQRMHRVVIQDEPSNVPRETSEAVMTESVDDIAFSYFEAMLEGQDWISLPPSCPVDGAELQVTARTMAAAVTLSTLLIDMVNGPGGKGEKLEDLLSRVWAAGFKSGSAATASLGRDNVPRETKEGES